MAQTAFTAYQQRNNVLLGMGFSSYAQYLQSSLWKGIRERQLMKQAGKVIKRKGTGAVAGGYSPEQTGE
ncbi:MAG: hypothetical protein KDA51_03945 [Planctomycetales bacterium]|nr:hypothetical protein [Planctomycetales bacterium]